MKKKVAVGLSIATLALSGCGANSSNNGDVLKQWTESEVKKINKMWFPATNKECESIISIFQEIQQVLAAEIKASTPQDIEKADLYSSQTERVALALLDLLYQDTSDSEMQSYMSNLKNIIPQILDDPSLDDKKMMSTLSAWKSLIGNPPKTCRNE